MDLVLKAAAMAAAGVALGLSLKRSNPEMTLVIAIAIAALLLYMAMDAVGDIIEFVQELADISGLSGEALTVVLKAVGIAIATRIASDVCRDAGQTSAASAVEIVGAAGAVYTALPLMRAVMDTVGGLK